MKRSEGSHGTFLFCPNYAKEVDGAPYGLPTSHSDYWQAPYYQGSLSSSCWNPTFTDGSTSDNRDHGHFSVFSTDEMDNFGLTSS